MIGLVLFERPGRKSAGNLFKVCRVLVWPVENWLGFNVFRLLYEPVNFKVHANLAFLQFHEAWHKLMEWLEESEKSLDSDLEIANDPDKIKMQLAQHKVSYK